jgi:hypothetical protein
MRRRNLDREPFNEAEGSHDTNPARPSAGDLHPAFHAKQH